MSERTFASLVSRVAASVPGCPQPVIVSYIRDSAIRTCERTLVWRYQIPLFQLQPGVYEYFFTKPEQTDVHAVFSSVVNGAPLETLTLDQAICVYPKWADLYSGLNAEQLWAEAEAPSTYNEAQYNEAQYNNTAEFVLPAAATADGGTPQSITQISPDKFIVLPMPDAAKTYQMRMFVALKPKKTATGMDEVILDDLEEVIMHGALQHLLVLPNQAWSDRELAAYHAKQYVFQTAERRARANLGNARGTLRARFPPF